MFRTKIEIWILYLIIVVAVLFSIGFGWLVQHEMLTSASHFPTLSKAAHSIAEIPSKIADAINPPREDARQHAVEDRFPNSKGFSGEPLEEESYLLLAKYDGDLRESIVELVDLRTFETIHTWNPDIADIRSLTDASLADFENFVSNTSETIFRIRHPMLTHDGGLIFQDTSPLIKIDYCGQPEWLNQEDRFHHSVEVDHDENYWVPTFMYPFAIGEDWVGDTVDNFLDDAITKVSPDGKILFQKSVSEIFIENGLDYLLFAVGAKGFTGDPIHLNDIQPVLNDGEYWKQGDVFFSIRHQSMVMLYRPSTHSVVWTGTGHTFHQHDVDLLDDHRIAIFNNNSKDFLGGDIVDGNNEVVIYDFAVDQYTHYLNESLQTYDVRTITQGRSQILDNGDLFIEETNYGRTLYFNADGSLQWQHVNRANDSNVYIVNWSRMLYQADDLNKIRTLLNSRECANT